MPGTIATDSQHRGLALKRAGLVAFVVLALSGCRSIPTQKKSSLLKQVHPVTVFEVSPFARLARARLAQRLGDKQRALRELGLAADEAPNDPYLRALWLAQKEDR